MLNRGVTTGVGGGGGGVHSTPQYFHSILIAVLRGQHDVACGVWDGQTGQQKHAKLSFSSFVLFYHSASSLGFEEKLLLLRPQINL